MSSLAGTGALLRLAARRDRILLAIWLYAFAALVGATVYGFKKILPTAGAREKFAVSAGHNPALLSLYGPFYGSSLGSFTAWRDGAIAALLAGLMSVFIVVRHTRADEESGRLELVGATAVGRHASLAAALVLGVGANVVIGVVITAIQILLGLPAAGAILLSAGIVGCGLVFTGIAALTAQIGSTARSARGLAIGVLGAAFMFRAIGDSVSGSGPRWLTWLSPIGWAELTRSFGQAHQPVGLGCGASVVSVCYADQGPRWWVVALALLTAAASVAGAALLAARRDFGAGLVAQRPGAGTAAIWLRTPLALAWRMQQAWLLWWLAGGLVFGVVLGSAAKGIGGLLSSAQIRRAVARFGGQAAARLTQEVLRGQAGLANAYLATILGITGLAVAAYAVATVLRLRAEETEQRADPVLATRTGRIGWGLSHLVIAAVGAVAILAVVGLGAGLGYGARAGGIGSKVATLVGAGLAQAPAVLVLAGITVALFGLAPQASVAASWSILGAAVLMYVLGTALQLSHWVLDLSPFTHVPKLPGGTLSGTPLVWLVLVAVLLTALGLAGLRRRDIGT